MPFHLYLLLIQCEKWERNQTEFLGISRNLHQSIVIVWLLDEIDLENRSLVQMARAQNSRMIALYIILPFSDYIQVSCLTVP